MTVREDSINEENKVQHTMQTLEPKGESLVSDRCRSELDSQQTLLSNFRSSGATSSCRELFFPYTNSFQSRIPKQITPLDEKYVLRCLELIRDYALKAEAWNISPEVRILPNDLTNLAESRTKDMVTLTKQCPLVAGADGIFNSSGEWALGSIMDSQSMMNILKSPLLRQYGSVDFDANSRTPDLRGAGESVHYDFAGFGHKLFSTFSSNSPKEATVMDCSKHVSSPSHTRIVSISSTNSSCSDQSSSSASTTSFQGMLQCTWNNGLPHHVFSVDDKREVYVANLHQVGSSGDKAMDYVYTFHSRKSSEKELDNQGFDLGTVAMMRVSTSISFSLDNSEVRETRFVISVSNNDNDRQQQGTNQIHKKNKRPTRRPRHSYIPKSLSKFPGSSAIFEDTPWDPSEDVHNNIDPLEAIADRSWAPNNELAAIVVKDVSRSCQVSNTGGWGLRFLKNSSNAFQETHLPSESTRNIGECSTSMDILIPAGLHGGPKARAGGPSSLIERWTSKGTCDCGGWDVGCPLTILSTQATSLDDSLSYTHNSGHCKSVDLFIKGSKQDAPTLKMVNIHEGLFYIHFQSTLSSLQSFAIAAAIIHSRSPSLRL